MESSPPRTTGKNALRRDVADAFADLIERFLQIAWDRADVDRTTLRSFTFQRRQTPTPP